MTVSVLRRWFTEGVAKGAIRMMVVCDTYDYEDYPVYIMPEEDVVKTYRKYHYQNMQRVMEVYDLTIDPEPQLVPGQLVCNL